MASHTIKLTSELLHILNGIEMAYTNIPYNNLPTKVKYHIDSLSEDWYYNDDNVPMEHDLKAEQELNFDGDIR